MVFYEMPHPSRILVSHDFGNVGRIITAYAEDGMTVVAVVLLPHPLVRSHLCSQLVLMGFQRKCHMRIIGEGKKEER